MYKYDAVDQRLVDERVNQYEGQLNRYLKKELSDEEFEGVAGGRGDTRNWLVGGDCGLFAQTHNPGTHTKW